ncbi:MAG: diguanylate cyclase [Deltaproteobacteria bacterium]|nr:diguanylate cyclase [Deltaproteobacteria bacterium]
MPGPRILLIEDDAIQAARVQQLLVARGMECHVEARGLEGFKVALEAPPDVVLLDLILPDKDGHEICRFLKAEATTRDVPVLMLTARTTLRDRVDGLNIGADDYVPKPFDDDELVARIHALLRLKNLQDQLKEKNRNLRELLSRLEVLAITDAVTGLHNRRHFMQVLESEFARAVRYDTPMALAMLDVDHFKAINDRFGHPTGDTVLEELGLLMRAAMRKIDVVARYGGEEFVVLLPQTAAADSLLPSRRLVARVAEHPFPAIGACVTVSIGIAGMPDARIKRPEDLVRLADDALYRAKRAGRNRVEMEPAQAP